MEVTYIDASIVLVDAKFDEFYYRGRYKCVPENFQFPRETCKLNECRLLLQGAVTLRNNVAYRIKPFSLPGKGFTSKEVEREAVCN